MIALSALRYSQEDLGAIAGCVKLCRRFSNRSVRSRDDERDVEKHERNNEDLIFRMFVEIGFPSDLVIIDKYYI